MIVLLFLATPVILVVALLYGDVIGSGAWSLRAFTAHLATMVRRNLPLGPAIRAFAKEIPWWWLPKKREMLMNIADLVEDGMPLADALERYPGTFPATYRALVRSAEQGGNLSGLLAHLSEFVEFGEKSGRRAAALLFYPACIGTVAAAIVALLMAFIVPSFEQMFEEMAPGMGIPTSLRLVGVLSSSMALVLLAFQSIMITGSLGPTVWFWLLAQHAWLARTASCLWWHVPGIASYERRRATGQYALAAGKLLEAGVPYAEALQLASTSSGNTCFDALAASAAESVREGGMLSDGLANADHRGRLPAEFSWYVRVGESSGEMSLALYRAADSAAARSQARLAHMVSLLYPVGIIAVGLIVGTLGYAFFETLVLLLEAVL